MAEINPENIYQGDRGQKFKDFIISLLNRGKLKPQYIEILLNKESMEEYSKAFTAKEVNPKDNYEMYEQMGDVTANKFIVWYSYKRFPQLNCSDGVAIVARLRINYGSKASFARIGDKLGFWPFITQTYSLRAEIKKTLIEDCFEAFIGCTESLLDRNTRVGVGYAIVYEILSSIFDEEPMSLDYYKLIDPITILKEIFDEYNSKDKKLGSYIILTEKDMFNTSTVYFSENRQPLIPITVKNTSIKKPRPEWKILGVGHAASKDESRQKASEKAIQTLKNMGYTRKIPEKYSLFC